jgi:hypothetical protein
LNISKAMLASETVMHAYDCSEQTMEDPDLSSRAINVDC